MPDFSSEDSTDIYRCKCTYIGHCAIDFEGKAADSAVISQTTGKGTHGFPVCSYQRPPLLLLFTLTTQIWKWKKKDKEKKEEKKKTDCLVISRTTGPNIDLFVLILMHLASWFQIWLWNLSIFKFLKFWKWKLSSEVNICMEIDVPLLSLILSLG